MVKITALIRPHQLDAVKTAIADVGIGGMQVNDVRGSGNGPDRSSLLGGRVSAFPMRSKITVVVHDELRQAVVDAILAHARTGQPGDGKIFIEPMADVVRIRTKERGDLAL